LKNRVKISVFHTNLVCLANPLRYAMTLHYAMTDVIHFPDFWNGASMLPPLSWPALCRVLIYSSWSADGVLASFLELHDRQKSWTGYSWSSTFSARQFTMHAVVTCSDNRGPYFDGRCLRKTKSNRRSFIKSGTVGAQENSDNIC
jgi:hypothetical protein